ncbi:MAG TPA: NAD(P)-binding domain-containing protein [Terracidiphilus sp.]|nr:NAD(P)-binding domain-containing protein [Terracidiphilus sp.]
MKVGVIGSGDVAKVLASGCLKHRHSVTIGTRSPEKLKEWAAENKGATVSSFAGAAEFGELIMLAVKGNVAADALRQAGAKNLAGKVIMDACNPIADAPPVNGVLQFYTTQNNSLMEQLQREFPEAKLVKAFNSVGAPLMVNPHYADGKPTMFICGNDAGAKKQVSQICEQFGWEVADMSKVESARAIEPLCALWCQPGFARNQWTHAFKLLLK